MSRRQRKAKPKRDGRSRSATATVDPGSDLDVEDLMERARWLHAQRQFEAAREVCANIIARQPAYTPALNLIGLTYQDSGHHRQAVKEFAKAVAADDLNAACHYNLAVSQQAGGRLDEAAIHFKRAIALGMSRKNIEGFIFQNPAVATCLSRIEETWPILRKPGELFGPAVLRALAGDVFLRCALAMVLVPTEPLERLFTLLRSALLGLVDENSGAMPTLDEATVSLFCVLAQQCFINEYVFAESSAETERATALRKALMRKADSSEPITAPLLAAVASYVPLHALPQARMLAERRWPEVAADLVRQQLTEPLAEADDKASIPVLTSVDDPVSLEMMQQYGENPYPRWTVNPLAAYSADEMRFAFARERNDGALHEILVAGCGTGQHAFQVAQYYPDARVLAVDISLSSLAFARRKTRETGLHNIEYAQADILGLPALGRGFDRIEAVGVLHHLAEPETGWRGLLSLLRNGGEMRVGLYSEPARRAIVAVRSLIAERGYRPTAEDIRKCRQEVLRDADRQRWKSVVEVADFYSMSGCRDMLFNLMEHRFTLPRVKAFLDEQRLSFLGFELEDAVFEKFQRQFPGDAALTELDCWQAFETANPNTFRAMYVFTVRKT
jgi:SAM-dependent methyltransferase